MTALGQRITVRYKSSDLARELWRDPVSDIDEEVEALIRERIGKEFPSHHVIGEEMTQQQPRRVESDYIWAVDPIDGTANFVNGFPLFAASIGVLYRGAPVVGAVWCSVSHVLRPGVYHARADGDLKFDNEKLQPKINPDVRRSLAGAPSAVRGMFPWDMRKTGSAAIECAFAAAGLLRVAKFSSPNLWDVAGGIPLVLASGGCVFEKSGSDWRQMTRFEGEAGENIGSAGLASWRRPLIAGDWNAVKTYCDLDAQMSADDDG